MSAHLKGPWRIVERQTLEDGSVYPRHVATQAGDYQICLLESANMAALAYDRTPAEQERDCVIATAPEMLDALEQALEFIADHEDVSDGDTGPVPNRAMSLATDLRAIIAKAGGAAS